MKINTLFIFKRNISYLFSLENRLHLNKYIFITFELHVTIKITILIAKYCSILTLLTGQKMQQFLITGY